MILTTYGSFRIREEDLFSKVERGLKEIKPYNNLCIPLLKAIDQGKDWKYPTTINSFYFFTLKLRSIFSPSYWESLALWWN